MSHQIENINKEMNYEKKQIEILSLKGKVIEIKFLLDGLNSIFKLAEERISKPKVRLIEIIQFKRKKRIKKK